MQSRSDKRYQRNIEKRSRAKSWGGGSLLRNLNCCCCRMDKDYNEEVSDQEEVAAVPPIPVFAVAPLNVEVPEIPDNPESPSLEPSPAASPPGSLGPESPQSLLGDAPNFLGFYSADDITELEQWAVDAQSLRGTPDLHLEDPEISANLKKFLKFIWGHQWELKSVQPAGRSSSVS